MVKHFNFLTVYNFDSLVVVAFGFSDEFFRLKDFFFFWKDAFLDASFVVLVCTLWNSLNFRGVKVVNSVLLQFSGYTI